MMKLVHGQNELPAFDIIIACTGEPDIHVVPANSLVHFHEFMQSAFLS